MPNHLMAWALAVWDGVDRCVTVLADDWLPDPKWNGDSHWSSLWRFELDEGGSYCLGLPPGPGLWVYECPNISHTPGDGWEIDPDTTVEGDWRPLRSEELELIAENPNLEDFVALDGEGHPMAWEHPELPPHGEE